MILDPQIFQILISVCVTELGKSMGTVFQPLEMLSLYRVSRQEIKKMDFQYTHNISLTQYLCVCLSDTQEWKAHINKIMSKASFERP